MCACVSNLAVMISPEALRSAQSEFGIPSAVSFLLTVRAISTRLQSA